MKRRRKPYSKLAVACGIIGVLGILVPSFISIYLSILACILGILALRRIKTDKAKGRLFAWIGIGTFLFEVLLLAIGLGYALFLLNDGTALQYSGNNAIKGMNSQELQFLHTTLEKITASSTTTDVQTILGKPSEIKYDFLLTSYFYYRCPYTTATSCSLEIDFFVNKARRIMWLDIKKFLYRTNLLSIRNN